MTAIFLDAVSKTFNPGQPNEHSAIRNLTLRVPRGKITMLQGPSGSGKTTLLAMMGLMSRPTQGRITILDRETTLLGEAFRSEFRRRHMGFLFQHFHLIPDLSVTDNLDLVLYPHGLPLKEIKTRRRKLLDRFGLMSMSRHPASILSGGEMQRLALARALMADPEIILVDEPTAHLDSSLSQDIITFFNALHDEGKTVVIASHDPVVLDSGIAVQTLVLKDGEILSPEEKR